MPQHAATACHVLPPCARRFAALTLALSIPFFVPVPSPHVPGRHPRPLRVSFPVSPALALPGPLSSSAS